MQVIVRVLAPAFIDHAPLDEDGRVTLEEGAAVRTLYRLLKIPAPLRPFLLVNVNDERARLDTRLRDGDSVSILFPLAGG